MIRWRIDSHPVRRIFKFFLYKEDDLQGYCYLQDNNTNLEILEMAFLDQKLIKPLLKHIVANHKKDSSSLLIILNPENEIAKEMLSVFKVNRILDSKKQSFFYCHVDHKKT
jgi:hypothetical protein